MKLLDWILVIWAILVVGFILAWAISDSWGNELRNAGGWGRHDVIEKPTGK